MSTTILHPGISLDHTDEILRVIHLHVKYCGVSSSELQQWGQHPFPMLREHPLIIEARDVVTKRLGLDHLEACIPQIVWQLPDEAPEDMPLTSHTDVPPSGREFATIAGLALCDWTERNGTLRVWCGGYAQPVLLAAGSLVAMSPDTEHSPGLNRSGWIRAGLYFRWMAT